MNVYYNEFDPFASGWLRQLINSGQISKGTVDEKTIKLVTPSDVAGHKRAHFFAGIGGWDYALRLAGWPEDREVWTGSCPCQPFSQAGRRRGVNDERHLWPVWRELIRKCRPAIIFGEQVASKDGRLWLSGIRADLEAMGYAAVAADLCAASVGAPHIRQRLFWMADAKNNGWARSKASWKGGPGTSYSRVNNGIRNSKSRETFPAIKGGFYAKFSGADQWDVPFRLGRDARWRRVEPAICPLVDGFPGRVGHLRGYGNAIVPQVAAEFIIAGMEAIGG